MNRILLIIVLMLAGLYGYTQDHSAIIASMENEGRYYNAVTMQGDFETAIEKVKSALKQEEFGIVSEIDMQAKLKKGTGKDIPRYTILGACNPPGAYRAMQIENRIGVMLPCNVIVRETEKGMIEVAAINPMVTMKSIGNPDMEPLAREISEKLLKALKSL